MFRPSTPASSPAPPLKQVLNRALLFAAGLLLLWVAVQLMPDPTPSDAATLYPSDSGTLATGEANRPTEGPSFFSVGYLMVLLLLGVGIGLAVYLRKKKPAPGAPSSLLQPLETLALSPSQQLQLVQCGGEVLLLGLSSGEITLLKAFDPNALNVPERPAPSERPMPSETLPRKAASPPVPKPTFSALLQQYAGRSSAASSPPQS